MQKKNTNASSAQADGRLSLKSMAHIPVKKLLASKPIKLGGSAVERAMMSVTSLAIYDVRPIFAKVQSLDYFSSPNLTTKHISYTMYAVHSQNALTGRSWIVYRRYSDFLLFRERILHHFTQDNKSCIQLHTVIEELYFPKKHRFRSKNEKVIKHRCQAFFGFLLAVHRVMISQQHCILSDECEHGLSIFRGFLGCPIVLDATHKCYSFPQPVLQHLLNPLERAPVNQCGTLKTVPEMDGESEEWYRAEHEKDEIDGLMDDLTATTESSSSEDCLDEVFEDEPPILGEY